MQYYASILNFKFPHSPLRFGAVNQMTGFYMKCNTGLTGLHKLKFFAHDISCTQIHFRCMSVHVENRACKRTDEHGDRKYTKLVLKPLATKNGLSIAVLCTTPFM